LDIRIRWDGMLLDAMLYRFMGCYGMDIGILLHVASVHGYSMMQSRQSESLPFAGGNIRCTNLFSGTIANPCESFRIKESLKKKQSYDY